MNSKLNPLSILHLRCGQPLRALLDTTRNLLYRRSNLSEYHRESYLNFLRVVVQIIQLPAADRAARATLREEITAQTKLPEKQWLLERLTAK